ncbi:hypothetical protein EUGRSUZ_C02904 [Eucalyptus grandis]|uniref:Uncharacterized protein n=2 Tax=Eucalyptus grandis TaxID=71139 RepID=A0ACC3LHH2_EUCGR|nr:hypothetical protein EUGRSUZ_C02904 [Eucalyptus grandis]
MNSANVAGAAAKTPKTYVHGRLFRGCSSVQRVHQRAESRLVGTSSSDPLTLFSLTRPCIRSSLSLFPLIYFWDNHVNNI